MNRFKSKRFFVVGAIVILLLFWYGKYLIYVDGPYSGKVIDAETKEPIEGAVVLVIWDKSTCTLGGGVSTYYNAKEVVTDKDGEFKVTKLISLSINPFWYLDDLAHITIFKPGYGYFPEHQVAPQAVPIELVMALKKHPTIELPRLKTIEERRQKALLGKPGTDVPYRKMKKMVDVINEERSYQGFHPYEKK